MTTSRSRTPKRRSTTSDDGGNFEIVREASQAPAEIDQDLHIPLSSRAVFWQPRHLALSDTLLHVPYLFWLVETCRPANIIQIGTGDGVGFLALCQAIDKLSLATPCIGLNPEPDAPSLPEPMAEQHQTHYDDFSFVIHEDPANAVRHVSDSGIDLLVVNTELTDDLVMALRAHWQSRLSDHAVVVVCNPDRLARRQPAREFLESLAKACPTIRLQHADNDIETYLVGKDQPERLKKLAALGIGAPGYLAARQVFMRLGQGLHQGQLARASEAALRKAETAVDDARKRLGQREEELQTIRRESARAQTSEAEQAAVAADLQARLFDAERALTEEKQNTVAREALEKLRGDLEKSHEERQAYYSKSTDLEAQNAELNAKLKESEEARETECAALREQLEASQTAHSGAAARVPELESQIAGLEKSLEERMADIVALSDGFEKRLSESEAMLEERVADIAALTRDYEKRFADMQARHDAERAKLSERLAHSEEKRREFLEAKRDLQEKIAALETHAAGHDSALASMVRQLEDVTHERDQLQAKMNALQTEAAEKTAQQLAERDTALARMARQLEDATNARDQFQQSVERSAGELEALTRKLEENEKIRHVLEEEKRQLNEHREALLSSTSWRVTGPIRKVKQVLSRDG